MSSIVNLIIRSKKLEEEIRKLEGLIKEAPEGRIVSRKSKNLEAGFKYTHIFEKPEGIINEKYLGKKDLQKAKQLANRMFAEKKLLDLKKEKTLIDKMITFRTCDSNAERFLKSHRNLHQLLGSVSSPVEQELLDWKKSDYIRNKKYPEGLIYTTVVPELTVRSKAEADIVSRLEFFGVPYHYEELVLINNAYYAIDFTCRHIQTGMIWYWDHRGMMDNPDYIRKTISCESAYLNAGIIQGINLIVTTETKNNPLDLQWVDELIQYFLL